VEDQARKPLTEKTVAGNVLKYRTAALNVGGCRVQDGQGGSRWPTNLMHDGSPAANAIMPSGAERYFYSAKATRADRAGSTHPTVKPLALMRWLVRLVTPEGGTVLDPFAGSGSTVEAALLEGANPVGCEITPAYWADIERKLRRGQGMPLAA
jgi:hypothetical protein